MLKFDKSQWEIVLGTELYAQYEVEVCDSVISTGTVAVNVYSVNVPLGNMAIVG